MKELKIIVFQVFKLNEVEDNIDSEETYSVLEAFAKEAKLIRMLRLWYPLPSGQKTFLQRYTFYKRLDNTHKDIIEVNLYFNVFFLLIMRAARTNQRPLDQTKYCTRQTKMLGYILFVCCVSKKSFDLPFGEYLGQYLLFTDPGWLCLDLN